jgi:predicted NBD/HSP70 family sugar kinase
MTQPRIGIDLGGTKIEAVVLDAQGNEGFRQRLAAEFARGATRAVR